MSLEKNQASQINDIETDLATIDGKIDIVDTNVDTVNTTTATTDGKVDTVNTKTDTIISDVNTVDGKIDIIDTNVDTINSTTTDTETKVDTIDTIVDTINQTTVATEAKVDIIDTNVDTINQAVVDIESKVDIIDTNVDTIEQNTIDIEAKIDIVDTNVDTIEQNTIDIEAKIDIIDTNVDTVITTLAVPEKNSANNATVSDVMGNKTDDEDGNSVYSQIYLLEKHFHSAGNVYPRGAGGITITKAAGAWAAVPAVKTEVVPVIAGIPYLFDIHWISISAISANGEYEIYLYSGLAGFELEITAIPATRSAVQSQEGSAFCMTDLIVPNTRISAALRGSPAGAESLIIKLGWHPY